MMLRDVGVESLAHVSRAGNTERVHARARLITSGLSARGREFAPMPPRVAGNIAVQFSEIDS